MREMHAVDINCIVRELQSILGSRVDKVFQDKSGVVRIRFYGGPTGRAELLIETGRRVHLTEYRRKGPKTPTSFAMYLRKHLGNRVLSGVSQHDFDRIVLLNFDDLCLVAEIFARGNIVLLDSESKVMLSMKRGPRERVSRGNKYVLPTPPISPFQIKDAKTLIGSFRHKDLVRSLAVDLGLGKLYANELCLSTGLDKNLQPSEITDEQALTVIEWISGMKKTITELKNPVIYGRDDPTEFSPFELESMKDNPITKTDSLNQAADRCYGQEEMTELEGEASSAREEPLVKLTKRRKIQRAQLDRLASKSEELRKLGDILYANFSKIGLILDQLRGEPKLSPAKIRATLAKTGLPESYVSYDGAVKTITIDLDGVEIPLNLRQSLGENANSFYEKAKNLEKRVEGARRAIRRTEMEMERSREIKAEAPKQLEIKTREAKWYEKFRWFFSSEGNLVLAGRDARSNETLVRRHLEDHDIYVHTEVQGAPSTIVKVGDGIGEETIQEACAFALIHSKIWKSGTTAGDVYWVTADQVTKRPTSGEYVARGAFVIRGRRNYKRGLEARCGIGYFKDRFMCGPLKAVQNHCNTTLEITPGEGKKSDIAKEIIARLAPNGAHPDLDQIIQVLPAGRLKVITRF